MTYEVEKNMVCSTCHVTEPDLKFLKTDVDLISVHTMYWSQINLGMEPEDLDDINSMYSEGFKNLIKFAKAQGFDNLKLDADGPVMVGFAKYDW